MEGRARIGALVAGPGVALAVYLLLPASYPDPAGAEIALTPAARAAAATGALMATWWLTEAISIYATALLPLVILPLAGAVPIKQAAAPYGHELIFLFLGGFIVALALERWGVHRRLAFAVLGAVGARPARIVGAFMLVSAALSMWVTNTATTLMLLPVALSTIGLMPAGRDSRRLALCLLLGVAYAASIGGIGTIVGTAPNLFVVSFIESQLGRSIGFATWMAIGVPLVIVFVPLTWWLLTRVAFPLGRSDMEGAEALFARLRAELGPPGPGERRTLTIFALTALAWITRPLLVELEFAGTRPLAGLSDPGIAVTAALALFLTPADRAARRFLMDWETAVRLPWGLLVLFGGGLSLAAALDRSGFSEFLGAQSAVLAGWPLPLVVVLVTALMIFLTELTSNTATTATLVPVLYAVAVGLGVDPLMLIIPAAIAASCAFMLPVATPPNAIVFGSGQIAIAQMSRAGLWLNVAGIVLIPLLAYAVMVPVLGLR